MYAPIVPAEVDDSPHAVHARAKKTRMGANGLLSARRAVKAGCAAMAAGTLLAGCTRPREPPLTPPVPASAVGISMDNAGSVWIAAPGHWTYVSQSGGHTWHRVPGSWGITTLAFLPRGTLLADGRRLEFAPSNGVTPARRLGRPPAPLRALATPYPSTGRVYALDTAGRLWVSSRNGNKWQPLRGIGLPPDPTAIAAVRGVPTQPDTIYVGSPNGIWKSTDFGLTFRALQGAPPRDAALATTTDNPQQLLVGGLDGIFRSEDGGATFTRVSHRAVIALASDWRNKDNAVGLTPGGTLLRSDDGGATW